MILILSREIGFVLSVRIITMRVKISVTVQGVMLENQEKVQVPKEVEAHLLDQEGRTESLRKGVQTAIQTEDRQVDKVHHTQEAIEDPVTAEVVRNSIHEDNHR